MFSPGSDGFSARSQLGGSPGSGSILPANRKEESRGGGMRQCAGQCITRSQETETNLLPVSGSQCQTNDSAKHIHF